MDSAAAAKTNFLQQVNVTNRTAHSAGTLEMQFLSFRPHYASTQSLFAWTPVTNGLGFNFKGWNGHTPRCDLEAALGTLGCGPICKGRIAEAKEKEEAEKKLEKMQERKYQEAMKKVMEEHF